MGEGLLILMGQGRKGEEAVVDRIICGQDWVGQGQRQGGQGALGWDWDWTRLCWVVLEWMDGKNVAWACVVLRQEGMEEGGKEE